MRVCLFVTLLFAVAIHAAPVPFPAPPSPPAGTAETTENGESFAFNLHLAVDLVAGSYVRPVPRAELLQAALTGLYEAARRPVPKDLRRRIDEAEKTAAQALAAEQATPTPAPLVPALAPGRKTVPDDRALLDLIRTIRAEIGKAESLEGEDPLRLCCQAMLRSLDPYSGLISANEQRKTIGVRSERDGFGLEVPDGTASRLVIKDVLPGSPAQRAGLRPGDEITHVHDSDGRERKLAESLDLLNGRVPLVKPESGALGTPEPIRVTFHRPPP